MPWTFTKTLLNQNLQLYFKMVKKIYLNQILYIVFHICTFFICSAAQELQVDQLKLSNLNNSGLAAISFGGKRFYFNFFFFF